MSLYLKNYWNCMVQGTSDNIGEIHSKVKKAQKYVDDYGKKLENQGWIFDMMDAGYISEDHKAIFYTRRTGHEGEICPYSLEGQIHDEDFGKIVESYVDMDDFISV